MGHGRTPRRGWVLLAALLALLVPAAALAAFPSSTPDESPRVNTPDDPEFDRCERDDEQNPGGSCSSYFNEEFRAFGFSPDTANEAPDPSGALPHYALHGDGSPVDGWPVSVGVLAGDLLPFVLPAHDAAVLDVDGDGDEEVSVSAATSITGQGSRLVDGNGETITTYQDAAADSPDQGEVVNLADYTSIGDLVGEPPGEPPDIIKGGLTLNGVANLLAVNQNLPFSHVEQAWDPSTGEPLPGYPRPTDDFQLLSQAAVARVAGEGPARQALVGTGLYQVHAYGPDGSEPAGWPKFTGGWNQVTPAVGDADGDGDLEVSSLTREGFSFLWETGVDACSGSNQEWWTFHHDEHSTAAYGHDARPPGTPTGLRASRRAGGSLSVSFTAPGDDWLCGRAARYRVLVSSSPIGSPSDGSPAGDFDVTVAAGERERTAPGEGGTRRARFVGVLVRDESGNWGQVASARIRRGRQAAAGCTNVIRGGRAGERLVGTVRPDRIVGRGGGDRIAGRGGGDCIKGGKGRDEVRGDAGADRIRPGAGRDEVDAGKGRDRVRTVRGGADRVDCGPGRDIALVGRGDRVRACEQVERSGPRG